MDHSKRFNQAPSSSYLAGVITMLASGDKEFTRNFLRNTAIFLHGIYFASFPGRSFRFALITYLAQMRAGKAAQVICTLTINRDSFSKEHVAAGFHDMRAEQSNTIQPQTGKPTLNIQVGDALQCIEHIYQHASPSTHIITQNMGTHLQPRMLMPRTSAESNLVSHSNVWLEMILTYAKEKHQAAILELIFATLLKINESSEDKFFNSDDVNLFATQLVRLLRHDYGSEEVLNSALSSAPEQCPVTDVYYLPHIELPIERFGKIITSELHRQLISVRVVTVAPINERLYSGSIPDALVNKVGKQIITDTLNIACQMQRQKPAAKTFLLMSATIGGDMNQVAECYAQVLIDMRVVIQQLNVQIVLEIDPSQYVTLNKILSDRVGAFYTIERSLMQNDTIGLHSAIPLPMTNVDDLQPTIELKDVDLTQSPAVADVLITSSSPHFVTTNGQLGLGTTPLMTQLASMSQDFVMTCANHPPIAVGEFADLGQHNFVLSGSTPVQTITYQMMVTMIAKYDQSDPLQVGIPIFNYVRTLTAINYQAALKNHRVRVALTLFGTGNLGWDAALVLELAMRTIRELAKLNLISYISLIYLVHQGMNDAQLKNVFDGAIKDADSVIKPVFTKFWQALPIETIIAKETQMVLSLDSPFDEQLSIQNATVFFTFMHAGAKGLLVMDNHATKSGFLSTPFGNRGNGERVVFTALNVLQKETGLNYRQLLEQFPNATFCAIDKVKYGNQFLHAFSLDLGIIPEDRATINLGFNSNVPLQFVKVDAILAGQKFKCDNSSVAKGMDDIMVNILRKLINVGHTAKPYLLADVLTVFDPENTLTTMQPASKSILSSPK